MTEVQAGRPALAHMDRCGYILGAGVGELSAANPISIDGDLWWLTEGAGGRLDVAGRWPEVLPTPEGGCHSDLRVAAGPDEAAALWLDGCGPERQAYFRRIRFSPL